MVAHEDTISIKNVLTGQIYSNIQSRKIEIESEFAAIIEVWQTGNVVSVDIDGNINATKNIIFAQNFPKTVKNPWVQDTMGRLYCIYYPGSISCTEDLNGWVNLHFTYLTKD